jgi:hypothetical protein
MEQVEQINPQDSSLPKCSELRNTGHDLAAAEDRVNVNCHWSISPAWCYAMATLDRLQEEQLGCLKESMQQMGNDSLCCESIPYVFRGERND